MWSMLEERLFAPLRSDRSLKAALPRDRGRRRGGPPRAGRGGRENRRHARALTVMHVVLVGFGPFPGAPFNPSAALVKALARRRRPALAEIVRTTHVFATTYAAVDRDLPKLIALQAGHHSDVRAGRATARALRRDPRAQCGLRAVSGRRRPLSVARHDRAGRRAAFEGRARLPLCSAPSAPTGFPARLSRDAGRYLCNYAYWRTLERLDAGRPVAQFVHIPPVRFAPRRPRSARGSRSFPQLVVAAERLLIALIAASRRPSAH